MSLAGDVIRAVIGERATLSEPPSPQALDATVKRAEHLISSGLEVSVQVLLVADSHNETDGREQTAKVLEVWTVQPSVSNEQGLPPMLPLFLKNAIRSHLHFSPIKSWASSNNNRLPKGYRCAYRLSTTSHFNANGRTVQRHSFPPCKEGEDSWLRITVQWLNKDDWLPVLATDALTDGVAQLVNESASSTPLLACTPRSEQAYQELLQSKCSPTRESASVPESKSRKAVEDAGAASVPLNRTQSETHDDGGERRKQSKREARIRRNTTGSSFVETPTCRRMPMSASFCGFNPKTKLPINSSPAPTKRATIDLARKLKERCTVYDDSSGSDSECVANTSPGSASLHTGLLCNFEESVLNGRLDPVGEIDGFQLQIAASGAFCIPHLTLPVKTSFFHISDDDTPSLYLGQCSLEDLSRKALHIPKKCTFQATLFNPHGSVVKIFIVRIDVSDMPAKSRTFIRQRTVCVIDMEEEKKRYLRYLVHLRLATDRRSRLYLHTDIRMLFSNKNDVDLLAGADGTDDKVRFSVETERPKYSPAK